MGQRSIRVGLAVFCLGLAFVVGRPVASSAASGGFPAHVVAPYVDTSLGSPVSLPGAAKAAGLRHFTLAFVLAGGACTATWNGVTPIDQGSYRQDVSSLRAMGGDVAASFGGAAGVELAQQCQSASALQAQYEAVIDAYQLTRIDFDVEGAAVADAASVDRRNQAIAGLEQAANKAGRPLTVSYTLPALPSGLTQDGLNVLKNAISHRARVDVVNVMAMDYGSVAPPTQMGQNAIDAGTALQAQLGQLYPSRSAVQRWAMVGVTPMIGVNDVSPEVFTLSDAAKLESWAKSMGIGELSMWSAGRDTACPSGRQGTVSPTCSGVSQSAWAFSKALLPFGA